MVRGRHRGRNARLRVARVVLTCAPVRAIWLLAAVGCSYRPGSFEAIGHAFAGQRVTLPCLDVAIARRPDGPLGSVIAYELGNRCEAPVTVDLGAATVVGRTRHAAIALTAYDPRHELRPLSLDGGAVASEAIEYRALVPVAFGDVCVEAGRIATGAGAWTCVGPAPEERAR